MDLNENGVLFSCNGELTKNTYGYGDTTLRLDCFGYKAVGSDVFGSARTNPGEGHIPPPCAPDDGCRLVLGLGPTPTAYSDDYYPCRVRASKSKGLADGDSILKLGLSGGMEDVSDVFEYSLSTQSNLNAPYHPNHLSGAAANRLVIPIVDEGSTSAKKSGGYMPSLMLAPKMDSMETISDVQQLLKPGTKSHCNSSQLGSEPSGLSDYSISTSSEPITVAETLSDRRTSNPKKCKLEGCSKGARGGTSLCIGHGGGQRCQKHGCNKGAESRTVYCKAHGGGKRCHHLGCTRSAEGRTDYCIAHGGGRRCGHPAGCTKAARGKSGLCIKHGGGKRCKVEGCARSAEGQIGLCISHGGGRRCQFPDCKKGAQGSTMYCKAHGGGKRCIFADCTKGAEGSTPLCKGHGGGRRCLFDGGGICPKSVHGGTNFCVAHGGGKRCAVAGCTKSARGRTDCCVRHGGGKRCKFEKCGKSAQGSTEFCKAHGGGKRCNWGGEGKCEKFARGRSGLCAAHFSMVQDHEKDKGGMIGPGLFHGLVPTASDYSSSSLSVMSDSVDSLENPATKKHLIPPQVLVPLSMKQGEGSIGGDGTLKDFNYVITEGRVHGGGLMSLLGGNLKNPMDGI
ncbi:uncharacterized protein LOC130781655 [Actinidia eriantha]|uniref:uncharacterized protein LOC130781655 n=1 Tax=Actinidia eriantha TaxID=165200 RepID=UPI002583B264|nr:uncharacterized protein LOC130781655 [Actinidia eriantha]